MINKVDQIVKEYLEHVVKVAYTQNQEGTVQIIPPLDLSFGILVEEILIRNYCIISEAKVFLSELSDNRERIVEYVNRINCNFTEGCVYLDVENEQLCSRYSMPLDECAVVTLEQIRTVIMRPIAIIKKNENELADLIEQKYYGMLKFYVRL